MAVPVIVHIRQNVGYTPRGFCSGCLFSTLRTEDCINRLSAPLPVAPSPDESPGRLPESVVSLLRQGVTCHVQAWKDAVARDAELRQFLGSSGVAKHPVWKEVFGSLPPRGVVSRMARRLGVDVHGNVGFYNYSSKKEFKREVRRIRDWYGVGRREVKSASSKRRKILRSAARRQARRVRSPARSIMNAKVKLHYARLLNKTRVQGLWRWRAAALAMLDAGLPMQTGTVAVELCGPRCKPFSRRKAEECLWPGFSFYRTWPTCG